MFKVGDFVRALPGSCFGVQKPGDTGFIVCVPSAMSDGARFYDFDVQFLVAADPSDVDGVWPGYFDEVELVNEETT